MKIRDFDVSEKAMVVAEIGNNHEGDFDVAKKLVKKAADCGVDAVKFQTFNTEHYVDQSDMDRFKRLKSFELSNSEFKYLSKLAHSLGLLFISTPFDLGSAVFLNKIVDCYKISSGDNTFFALIDTVCKTGKSIIVSTGMSDWHEVEKIVSYIQEKWADYGFDGQLAVLHCVSSYPVLPEQANLNSIKLLAERLNVTVGYSDHTIGVEASVLAVALGARVIEKHFTLDKKYSDFRDHELSADPKEMKEIVERIRLASSMLGKHEKKIQESEKPIINVVRRSIVAGRDMPKGHQVVLDDLTWVRPAGGLSPGEEDMLLGKKLKYAVLVGDKLLKDDVN